MGQGVSSLDIMVVTILVLAIIVVLSVILLCRRYVSNEFNQIDKILDSILSKKQGISSDANGEYRKSKLAHKAVQIIKMTAADISKTTEEKETIQSFISDMSHQIKTLCLAY